MDDLPSDFARLDNKAAYDRIAVRPKARKAARKARGRPQHVLQPDSRYNGFNELTVKDEVEEENVEFKEDLSPKAKRSRPPSESATEEPEAPKTPNKRFSYLGAPGMVVPSLHDVQNIKLKKTSPLEEEKKPVKQEEITQSPTQPSANSPQETKTEKKSKSDLFSGRFFHKSKGQKSSKSDKEAEKKKAKEEKTKSATSPLSPVTKKKDEKATKASEKSLLTEHEKTRDPETSISPTLSPTSPVSEKEQGKKKTTDKPIFKMRFGRDKSKDSGTKEPEPEKAAKSPVNPPTSPARSPVTKQIEQKENPPGVSGDQSDKLVGDTSNKVKLESSQLGSPTSPSSPKVVPVEKPIARPRLTMEKSRDHNFAAALRMFSDTGSEEKQEEKGGGESRRNYSENNSKSVDSDSNPVPVQHTEDETREMERKRRAKSESERENVLKNERIVIDDKRVNALLIFERKEEKAERSEEERNEGKLTDVKAEPEAIPKKTIEDDLLKDKRHNEHEEHQHESTNKEKREKISPVKEIEPRMSQPSAQAGKKPQRNFSIKSYQEANISPTETLPDNSKSSSVFTVEVKSSKTSVKNEVDEKKIGNKGFEVQSICIVEQTQAHKENIALDSTVDENQAPESPPEKTSEIYSKKALKPVERAQTNRVIRSTERRHQSMNLGPSSPKPKRTQSLQNKPFSLVPKETIAIENIVIEKRSSEKSKIVKDDVNNNTSLANTMIIQEKSPETEKVTEEANIPKPKARTTTKNPPTGARKLSVKKETTSEESKAPAWVSLARRRSKVWEDAGVRDIKTSSGSLKQTKTSDNRPNSLSLPQKPTSVNLKSRENAPQSEPTATKPIVIARKTAPDSPLKSISPLNQSSPNRKSPLNNNVPVSGSKKASVLAQKESPSGPAWLAIAMQKQKRWTKEETA